LVRGVRREGEEEIGKRVSWMRGEIDRGRAANNKGI
jgi:hypothetical protein